MGVVDEGNLLMILLVMDDVERTHTYKASI